jgi:HSP20 family protein
MNTYIVTRNNRSWNPLFDLRREMDRLFDDFWTPTTTQTENAWHPACDVEENDDHYLMTVEMPGVPRDQIKIECVDNQVTISGERSSDQKKSKAYSDRYYGKFYRSFTLPAGVNADKVEANYQDGILRLYVPKAESAKPRQIKITNGSEKGFFGKLLGNTPKEKEGVHSSDENKVA